MKRAFLWALIFAAVLLALVGAAVQVVHGTKPLLFS